MYYNLIICYQLFMVINIYINSSDVKTRNQFIQIANIKRVVVIIHFNKRSFFFLSEYDLGKHTQKYNYVRD